MKGNIEADLLLLLFHFTSNFKKMENSSNCKLGDKSEKMQLFGISLKNLLVNFRTITKYLTKLTTEALLVPSG